MAKQTWDRYSIKAEIQRKGSSLRELSLKNGLSHNICSMALYNPLVPSAEVIISEFLEVPAKELWPDRYHANGERKTISYRSYYLNKNKHYMQCLNEVLP